MIKENEFNQFDLSEKIVNTLQLLGYNKPTEIQKMVIPYALYGEDIVARSQTGSGKTAAFAIPVCEKVNWEENLPQVLVLEPTRELTVQVREEIFNIGRKKRLKVADVFGGFPIDKQIQTLKQKTHIVVGTPGRIMDHIRRESLNLSNIRYLIIDEADLMLNMGFMEEVEEILSYVPENKQTMLFSATLGESIEKLVKEYMKTPKRLVIENPTQTVEEVKQECVFCENEEKYETLLQLLVQENPEDCMIFCGTREMVNVLCQKMKRDRIRCGMIHGELEQGDRIKAVEDFRQGAFHCFVATDVAARGIDFENITHVFQYDFPTGKETYVHRAGRTGRNGKTGASISMISEADIRMKETVEEYIGQEIQSYQWGEKKSFGQSDFLKRQKEKIVRKEKKGAVLNRNITRLSIGGGKKSKMRAVDLVGTICSIEGMTAADIGIIDIRESLSYVEILNSKGKMVCEVLQEKPIKGKLRKVRVGRI